MVVESSVYTVISRANASVSDAYKWRARLINICANKRIDPPVVNAVRIR